MEPFRQWCETQREEDAQQRPWEFDVGRGGERSRKRSRGQASEMCKVTRVP